MPLVDDIGDLSAPPSRMLDDMGELTIGGEPGFQPRDVAAFLARAVPPVIGSLLGAAVPLPGASLALGGVGGALGEYAAEKIEGRPEVNMREVGVGAVGGMIPMPAMKAGGGALANILGRRVVPGAVINAADEGARQYVRGEELDPYRIGAAGAAGGALSGLIGIPEQMGATRRGAAQAAAQAPDDVKARMDGDQGFTMKDPPPASGRASQMVDDMGDLADPRDPVYGNVDEPMPVENELEIELQNRVMELERDLRTQKAASKIKGRIDPRELEELEGIDMDPAVLEDRPRPPVVDIEGGGGEGAVPDLPDDWPDEIGGAMGKEITLISPDRRQKFQARYRTTELDRIQGGETKGIQPRADKIGRDVQIQDDIAKFDVEGFLASDQELNLGHSTVGRDNVIEQGHRRRRILEGVQKQRPDKWQELQDEWRRRAVSEYGLDPKDISGPNTAIVLERLTPVSDRRAFARLGNRDLGTRTSAAEDAAGDAVDIDPLHVADLTVGPDDTLQDALMRASNAKVVAKILNKIPANERQALMLNDATAMNRDGAKRVANALAAYTFNDDFGRKLVGELSEVAQGKINGVGLNNIQAALNDVLPRLAATKAKAAAGLSSIPDMSPDIIKAVRAFIRMRSGKVSIEAFMQQIPLKGQERVNDLSPLQLDILRGLDKHSSAPAQLREFLSSIVAAGEKSAPKSQGALFATPGAEDVVANANRAASQMIDDMPAAPPPDVPEQAGMFPVAKAEAEPAVAPEAAPEAPAPAADDDGRFMFPDGDEPANPAMTRTEKPTVKEIVKRKAGDKAEGARREMVKFLKREAMLARNAQGSTKELTGEGLTPEQMAYRVLLLQGRDTGKRRIKALLEDFDIQKLYVEELKSRGWEAPGASSDAMPQLSSLEAGVGRIQGEIAPPITGGEQPYNWKQLPRENLDMLDEILLKRKVVPGWKERAKLIKQFDNQEDALRREFERLTTPRKATDIIKSEKGAVEAPEALRKFFKNMRDRRRPGAGGPNPRGPQEPLFVPPRVLDESVRGARGRARSKLKDLQELSVEDQGPGNQRPKMTTSQMARSLKKQGLTDEEIAKTIAAGRDPHYPNQGKLWDLPDEGGRLSSADPDLPPRGIFKNVEGKDDIVKIIHQLAIKNRDRIEFARRGIVSDEFRFKQARRLLAKFEERQGMEPGEMAASMRQRGLAVNAETLTAIDMLYKRAYFDLELAAAEHAVKQNPISLAKMARAYVLAQEITPQRFGAGAEAGRALRALRFLGPVSPKQDAIRQAMKILGGEKFMQDVAETINLFDPGDIQGLNNFLRDLKPATTREKLFELWVNSLLSGPQTHIVNAVSNALVALDRPISKLAASAIDAVQASLTGRERQRYAGEANADLYGMITGTRQAWAAFRKAWKTELPSDASSRMLDSTHGNFRAIKGRTGRFVRSFGGRPLVAADEFFKVINERGMLHAEGYRQAIREGLTGKARAERIADIVLRPQQIEGLVERIKEERLYRTFQTDLGEAGELAVKLRNKIPGASVLVPFMRTPVNITKFGLERTPWGMLRLMQDIGNGRVDAFSGEAADRLTRSLMGSTLMFAVASYAAEGKITGAGPKDPVERKVWRQAGNQPYSVKMQLPGMDKPKWFSYGRLEPLGIIMGLAADAVEISDFVEQEDAAWKIAAAITQSLGVNLANKTFLKGISDAMAAWHDSERYGERWVQSLVGTGVPTIAAHFARAVDPTLRQPRSLTDVIKSRVPFWSKELGPIRDVWGEPIRHAGLPDGTNKFVDVTTRFLNPIRFQDAWADPASRELQRLGVKPSSPHRTLQLGREKIQPTWEEYDKIVARSGRLARQRVDKLITLKAYQSADIEAQRKAVRDAFSESRAIARAEWKRDYVSRRRGEQPREATAR